MRRCLIISSQSIVYCSSFADTNKMNFYISYKDSSRFNPYFLPKFKYFLCIYYIIPSSINKVSDFMQKQQTFKLCQSFKN